MENSGAFFLDFLIEKAQLNEETERHESMPWMNANLAQSWGNVRTQNYCSLMLRYRKGKWLSNHRKTAKNGKESS